VLRTSRPCGVCVSGRRASRRRRRLNAYAWLPGAACPWLLAISLPAAATRT
jgi:hypothetical protein